ncbi:hypothetical protein BGZ63DRAFT_53742 [Mariannaea sp. PMI_226]|nr:hypothetical protein BGZ63DRAFT_53742 [Mariannaea sp. PMI_226]
MKTMNINTTTLTTNPSFLNLGIPIEGQVGTQVKPVSQNETDKKLEKPKEQQNTTSNPVSHGQPVLCRDILSQAQLWSYTDGCETEFACPSESDSGFTSDTEPWSDHEDDDHDEFVLCLTSRGARPLDSTSDLRPPLPRRLSFKPLETTDDQVHDYLITGGRSSKRSQERCELASENTIVVHSENIIFRNDFFEISKSKIAGFGAFAIKPLKYGDRILDERPLLMASSLSLFKEFGKLNPQEQKCALSLHANEVCKPGTPKLQAIWMANW